MHCQCFSIFVVTHRVTNFFAKTHGHALVFYEKKKKTEFLFLKALFSAIAVVLPPPGQTTQEYTHTNFWGHLHHLLELRADSSVSA